MNPYYASGFLSALVFWVWPAFLFQHFDVHWLTVLAVSAILFLGIGKLAAAVAEGVARQPSAAAQISGATNLPLFLLEGVAILAEVFALLIVLMK